MQITTATAATTVPNTFLNNLDAATGDQLRMAWEALHIKAGAATTRRSRSIAMGRMTRVQAELDRRGLNWAA